MPSDRRSAGAGVAFAAAGAIAFSGKAIIVKLAYRYGVDAITLLLYRMAFALPLFLVLAWWSGRGKPPLTARDWRSLFALGTTGYCLSSVLDFAGLQYVNANLERLILYQSPTIVLVLSVVLFRTRVSRRHWLALAVSYLGVVTVFGHDATHGGPNVVLGSALVFGSAVSYAVYLVLSNVAVKRLGALRISGIASSIACLLCILLFLATRPVEAIFVAPEVIWLSLLNATLCTFCPVLFVMLAVERIGAAMTAQTGMIGPLSTVIMSYLWLGEPFTGWIALGTALVLVGVWLLARRR
jgi:drug/metabolite transporter (DMT)-like permease